MPATPHTIVINIPPNLREKVLEQEMDTVYGREMPDFKKIGKETVFFYMFNLSQIVVVGRSVNSISRLEKNIRSTIFSCEDDDGRI